MSDLSYSIWRRYGGSPGAIPLRFGVDLASRGTEDRLPLLGEVQSRWSPDVMETSPVRWPERFEPASQPFNTTSPETGRTTAATGTAIPVSSDTGAERPLVHPKQAPSAMISRKADTEVNGIAKPLAFPLTNRIQRSSLTSGSMPAPVEQHVATTNAVDPPRRYGSATALLPQGIASSVGRPRAAVQTPSNETLLRSISRSIEQSPAATSTESDTPPTMTRPTLQLREQQPKMLQRAVMASAGFAPSSRNSQPAPSLHVIQRSVAVESVSNEAIAPSGSTPPVPQSAATPLHSIPAQLSPSPSSSELADEAMNKILRRLAIERERRGGRRWL